MKVALYLRVSTEEQTRGFSLETQQEDLEKWVADQGWTVAATYSDPGVSGTDALKRPGFQAMMVDARRGLFERVLVKSRSRYARNVGDAGQYDQLLGAVGVTVWSLSEPGTNGATAEAFLIRGFHDLINAHYSVDLSQRVRRGKEARAQKGLHNGVIPFGYRRSAADQPLEPDPEEAPAVAALFNMYLAGTPVMRLTAHLNDNGFRTRRGSLWQVSSVRQVLSNATYTGDVLYQGEVLVVDAHPAVIDRTTYNAAVGKKAKRPVRHSRNNYMLSGLATCSECGKTVWTNVSKGRYGYYRCSTRDAGIDSCPATGVPAGILDSAISVFVTGLHLPDDWQAEVLGASAIVWKTNERERLQDKLARTQQALLDGLVPYEKAKADIKDLQRQLTDIQATPAIVDIASQFTDAITLWPHGTPAERRSLLVTLFDVVSIDIPNKRLAAVKPKPVFADLFPALARDGGPLTVCSGDSRLASTLLYTNREVAA